MSVLLRHTAYPRLLCPVSVSPFKVVTTSNLDRLARLSILRRHSNTGSHARALSHTPVRHVQPRHEVTAAAAASAPPSSTSTTLPTAATKTWIDKAPERLRPYLHLTRIDKPIGTLLLFYPCSCVSFPRAPPLSASTITRCRQLGLFSRSRGHMLIPFDNANCGCGSLVGYDGILRG